jgi:multidrug efflux system membrane fusion protein
VAQQEALVNADQAAIDNAQATLGHTKIVAPLSGRTGLRQVDQGNVIHAADDTGVAVITQLQPIAVQFSLPQQQIVRVNASSAKGVLTVDVFGNDGSALVDTGKLTGIDNQVDQTTDTLKLEAELPNSRLQMWPGQFVNVRLKVETLSQAIVIPTSAAQRGPVGTFSYGIGDDDTVTAKQIVVTQQNETNAVIAPRVVAIRSGGDYRLSNLSDGSKVVVGKDEQTPTADLAPRKRQSKGKDGQGEQRSKRSEERPEEGEIRTGSCAKRHPTHAGRRTVRRCREDAGLTQQPIA